MPLVRADAKRSAEQRADLARHYVEQAVAFLRKAQAAGAFVAGDQVDELKRHQQFDPLRSDLAFQKLLADVESQAKQTP